MSTEVSVSMPLQLTPAMIRAVRDHPTTKLDGEMEDWHTRLGWLICAYDVLLEARCQPLGESRKQ